jgi:hypothetical protein
MGFQLKNCGVRKRKLRKNMNIKNWSVIGTGAMLFVALGFNVNSQAAPVVFQIKTGYRIVPAPTSPNNIMAMQNLMNYMAKGWSVGLIDTDSANNPAALNAPPILRVCQFCFGPSTYLFWDGANNPTGAFASENGSRLAWIYDVRSTSQFQVSDGSFTNWLTDPANTLRYGGNLATNTDGNVPNYFGDTLHGQVWSGNKLIADYQSGESITNPVTRVFGTIRVGYWCVDSNALANDLNYFKGVMEVTNGFAIRFPNGGATNQISSIVYLDPPNVNRAGGTSSVDIEGQRRLGLYYNLYRSFSLNRGSVWTNIGVNLNEGIYVDSPVYTNAFYRASESSVTIPAIKVSGSKASQVPSLRLIGANGPE